MFMWRQNQKGQQEELKIFQDNIYTKQLKLGILLSAKVNIHFFTILIECTERNHTNSIICEEKLYIKNLQQLG